VQSPVNIETDLGVEAVALERRRYFRWCCAQTLRLLRDIPIPLREAGRDAYYETDGGARKNPSETGSASSVDVLHFGPPSAKCRDLTQNVNLPPKRESNYNTETVSRRSIPELQGGRFGYCWSAMGPQKLDSRPGETRPPPARKRDVKIDPGNGDRRPKNALPYTVRTQEHLVALALAARSRVLPTL
jgi:hypothetical protein